VAVNAGPSSTWARVAACSIHHPERTFGMKIDSGDYCVAAGGKVRLAKWPTDIRPLYKSENHYKELLAAELEHDFLWRTTCRLPARGRIGVFNRSYYEEVLIVRVHPEILLSERVPDEHARGKAIWKERFRSIVDFEKHMHRNGTPSTRHAPWHVVPADDKLNARLIVSRVLIGVLRSLGMRYPGVSPARRRELHAIRMQLAR
jgi:hypothetical protein